MLYVTPIPSILIKLSLSIRGDALIQQIIKLLYHHTAAEKMNFVLNCTQEITLFFIKLFMPAVTNY
jgi:hypothetical protein